ncbi:7398_t:CDS:2 [Diversispora eburnea]|uniref:7398_t:CDS:1 n=1 Tax=Diversispora eburnea TaxID=1213867 RepID=A0A9N8VEK3_9GLOM|nr:7398_t:CDS:2 [Diversispora eburnea]
MMNLQNIEILETENATSRDAYHSIDIEEQDATFLPTSESFDSIQQIEESDDADKSNSIENASIMETIIDQSIITPSEKKNNAEFFFHAYLESIGAINVGEGVLRKRPRVVKRKALDSSTNSNGKKKAKKANEDENWTLNGRGKKVRNGDDDWNDQDNDEAAAYDMVGPYDPFRLVPPLNYTSRNPAPFRVSVSANVMLVMDFHAHLAHTEIIGLLGGHFYPEQESMEVTFVYPCKSASTGFQCEMDPASEVAAREVFAEKGLEFVGWYHSHPTFDPQPSIRDIENQTQYQVHIIDIIDVIESNYTRFNF